MKTLCNIFIASTCLKVLLFAAYHSTDFDVHRNWLAITNALPISKWYIEDTSQWTLDYPPFFAWFEWFISQFIPESVRLDGALDITVKGQYGWPTVVFQRCTVIISELVLFAGLQYYIYCRSKRGHRHELQGFAIAGSIALSPGLLIIDHIHFQYNGFMYGLLVLSITAAMEDQLLLAGALFAVLLCFKHIYLYLAPAYFVYLLRCYILKDNRINWLNGIKLGSTILTIFAVAFGPFVYMNQVPQLLGRLFPFSRGLTHAYWAPNIWAVYSFLDRVLVFVYNLDVTSATRGLVGDVKFGVLPDIEVRLTFFLTLFYQIVALIPLAIWPSFSRFLGSLTLCGYASFLFGWHVHEKAILLVIFPISFLALKDKRVLSCYIPLVVAGYLSLFPLIYTPGEELIKTAYTFVWFVMFLLSFNNLAFVSDQLGKRVFLLDRISLVYMVGFIPCMLSTWVIDKFVPRYEFLSLMIISVYCAIGVIGSWAGFSWLYFFDDSIWAEEKILQKTSQKPRKA